MEKLHLQYGRMAAVAMEYCTFVDNFNEAGRHSGYQNNWLVILEKLFPRLHVAVIALAVVNNGVRSYHLCDDDQRCEMFLRLNAVLKTDDTLWDKYVGGGERQQSPQELCERMADNIADMYFDLKRGLELVDRDPALASSYWQSSFYAHWGKHLLDAECWLHCIDAGGEPPLLPEWQWPNTPGRVAGVI